MKDPTLEAAHEQANRALGQLQVRVADGGVTDWNSLDRQELDIYRRLNWEDTVDMGVLGESARWKEYAVWAPQLDADEQSGDVIVGPSTMADAAICFCESPARPFYKQSFPDPLVVHVRRLMTGEQLRFQMSVTEQGGLDDMKFPNHLRATEVRVD